MSTMKTYVDNTYNRQMARVGKPLGSAEVPSSSKTPRIVRLVARCYKDTPTNRGLGRVGLPYGSGSSSSQLRPLILPYGSTSSDSIRQQSTCSGNVTDYKLKLRRAPTNHQWQGSNKSKNQLDFIRSSRSIAPAILPDPVASSRNKNHCREISRAVVQLQRYDQHEVQTAEDNTVPFGFIDLLMSTLFGLAMMAILYLLFNHHRMFA